MVRSPFQPLPSSWRIKDPATFRYSVVVMTYNWLNIGYQDHTHTVTILHTPNIVQQQPGFMQLEKLNVHVCIFKNDISKISTQLAITTTFTFGVTYFVLLLHLSSKIVGCKITTCQHTYMPVSYTHLDVYKRQPQEDTPS